MELKALAKRLLALTRYRLSTGAANRFDANEQCLLLLAKSSFAPSLIVDGGANLGAFAEMAHRIFPAAAIHMIEPQPGCGPALQRLARKPGFLFHPVAVTAQAGSVRMLAGHDGDTGAHITWAENQHEANLVVQATTLDALIGPRCGPADRILLKLDLQGHELMALRGASSLLPKVEVVLIEVSFFQQLGEPTIPDLVRFLDVADFDLFDVASLGGRTRDGRLRQGDFVFVRRHTPLWSDRGWH